MPEVALQHIELLQQFSYFGVFIAVILAGHFVPVPEDISLIMAGYIVALGYANLIPMLVIGIIGPIIADGILFYLARSGSKFVPPMEKYAPGISISVIKGQLENHTLRSVFWMRFITGFRFMSPVLSGYIGISPKKYMTANAFSALFFGPFFVLLGYFLAAKITGVLGTLNSLEHIIFFIIGGALFVFLGVLLKNYISRKRIKT